MKSRTTSRLPTSTRGCEPGLDLGDLPRQAAQHVGGRLPRAGVVERADHHDVGAVRQEVLDAQQVGRRLARGVRVVRPQRARLVDRQVLGRGVAVADPRADQHDPRLQPRRLDRLQQVQRPAEVQGPGAPRVGHARLRVRLRGEVVDHLGLLAADQVGQLVLGRRRPGRTPRSGPAAPRCASPAGQRPDADSPTTRSPAVDQVLDQVPPHEPRDARSPAPAWADPR